MYNYRSRRGQRWDARNPGRTRYVIPTYGRVRSSEHRMDPGAMGGLAILGLFLLWIVWTVTASFVSMGSGTLTILRTDDQSTGSNGHQYLVYTEHPDGTKEVFKDTDAWLHGKTRSSDLFFSLHKGEVVTCTWNGYRWGLTSSYRNLLSCTPKH